MTADHYEALHRLGMLEWPAIPLSLSSFEAFVTAREGDERHDQARAADLYLACACLSGSAPATEEFIRRYAPELERAAKRLKQVVTSPEDVRQSLLDRILVGTETRPAKLVSYNGHGSLIHWVRAVAARAVIDMHRRAPTREVSGDDTLFETLTDSSDPEIQYFKKTYRAELKRAFEDAVKSLDSRERNTLRHIFVESLTIDDMAGLYNIHRSTAARRMSATRDKLLQATREALLSNLQVDDTALNSIMRLIDSHFDLSLNRVLQTKQQ